MTTLELMVMKKPAEHNTPRVLFFKEGLGVCALKQLISPVNMFFTLMFGYG